MDDSKLPTNSAAQRLRLLTALRKNAGAGVTSHFANTQLGIYHPPARIKELRDAGYRIVTRWRTIETEACRPRRVALYLLIAEAARGL